MSYSLLGAERTPRAVAPSATRRVLRRKWLLETVATGCLLAAATHAHAQTTGASGGMGGGAGGGTGGAYRAMGGNGAAAAPDVTALAGGGGNGADTTPNTASSGAADPAGNHGGSGGPGGASTATQEIPASPTGLLIAMSTSGGAGMAGGVGTYNAASNQSIDLGGGGGGGGGNGLVVAGTGVFGATAQISGGNGGAGGAAQINDVATATSGSANTGYGSGNFGGGNGGFGGLGLILQSQGVTATIGPNATGTTTGAVAGGNGGAGGGATFAHSYGTAAVGSGGNGGGGGVGVLASGPASNTDPSLSAVTIVNGSSATGGTGGAGGVGYGTTLGQATTAGYGFGGNGGNGALGVSLLSGASMSNAGAVTGGAGGAGGDTVIQVPTTSGANSGEVIAGTGGAGGAGVSLDAYGTVTLDPNGDSSNAYGTIIGGAGGNGGTVQLNTNVNPEDASSVNTFAGSGGAGGNGVTVLGPASMTDSGAPSVSVNNFAQVRGGDGGTAGNADYGNGEGGSGGNGGIGLRLDNGAVASIGGRVTGGNGGTGGDGESYDSDNSNTYGGTGGTGGIGVELASGGLVNLSSSSASVTGGNGGAGGTSAYGAGLPGDGGRGGDGIRLLSGGSIISSGSIQGGSGGNSGANNETDGTPGAGGAGINGVAGGSVFIDGGSVHGGTGGSTTNTGTGGSGGDAITGAYIDIDNYGTIIGGTAGTGNTAQGLGGNGVNDIGLSGSGDKTTITNEAGSLIQGGTGTDEVATNGNGFFRRLAVGGSGTTSYGDTAIVGSDLQVINAGTISHGTDQNGAASPYAILFTGGTNSVTLEPGQAVNGGVVAYSMADAFILGGAGADTFDVSQIDGSGATYFQGFGSFTKQGTSTWTLTGTTATSTAWDIQAGILAISSDGNLGASSAGVTLDGGSLEVTNPAGTTTSTLVSGRTYTLTANGGGLITDAGVTLELTGTIVDNGSNGGLTKTGSGVLLLTADNTYTGGTSIAGGRVEIATAGGLGSGQVTMAAGTTLAFLNPFTFANAVALTGPNASTIDTGANANTLSGPISGSGGLTKAGSGTLTLLAANTYTGGTYIEAGAVAIARASGLGTGTVTMAAGTTLAFLDSFTFANAIAFTGLGDPTIDTGPNNVTISSNIDGPDALTKLGTGTLTLTGTNGYTGATTIAQGTLLVNGSTAASVVTAEAGTILGGFGTVGGIVAQSGATVAPGLAVPYSTLRVNGNVAFQGGSAFQVHVDGTTSVNDAVVATGTARIGGGSVAATTTGSFAAGQRFTLLTAAGGRTGTFTALTTSSTFAFLTPELVYDPTRVILTFVANATTPQQVGATPNQRAAGSGLPPSVFGLIQGLSVPGAQRALDQLSGEGHASVETAAVQAARIVSTAVFDRLWNIGGASGDAYDVLRGFGSPLPTLLRCYAPGDSTTRDILSSYSVWAVGLGDFGHFGGNGNAASLDTSLGGFIGGVDMPIYAGSAIWRLGIAGGYANDDITVSDRSTTGTFESVFGTLYGGVRVGAFDARFGAGVAGNSTNLQRTVAFPGFSQGVHSSYGGMTVQGFGEIGYRFSFNQKVFEPVAGFTAISVHQGGFREDGGLAALSGRAHDTDVQSSELGFRAEATPFASLPLVARLHLAWQHSFGDLDPASVLAFEAGGSAFQVTGAPIDRDAALVEAGADYRATAGLTVGLNYVGTLGPRDQYHAVRGKVEYRF